MIMNRLFLLFVFFTIFLVNLSGQNQSREERKVMKKLQNWQNPVTEYNHVGEFKLDSIAVDPMHDLIGYYFTKDLSFIPWRNKSVNDFRKSLHDNLPGKLKKYDFNVYTNGYTIKSLIPNIYQEKEYEDSSRILVKNRGIPLVIREGKGSFKRGLDDKYIALWHSHGLYYESSLNRWEWQRARLYGSVEDVSPMSFVIPYLVPMLENAGATVFLPRERSFQTHEVIVDNDTSDLASEFKILSNSESCVISCGFLEKDTIYPGDNPFLDGSSVFVQNAHGKIAEYVPDIPQKGTYAVYISYKQEKENSEQVKYVVHHTGGSTFFLINQRMGGGTWIYLGDFVFDKGVDKQKGSVEVFGSGGNVSLDAVRFGGGMGNVARGKTTNEHSVDWKISKKPRYLEGARYWLQYAGMPDTLVYSLNGEQSDYKDDYMSRGEWVDYLMGNPLGPTNNHTEEGLHIPIDLSFAFHTDAGVTPNDSAIGTLAICSTERDNRVFPNGQSKLASRDLADLIQTQVVHDIRSLYRKDWTRRGLWDKQYSEAWRPNVPAMLLELYSHQNIADMKLGLDPRFRFDVSRAIYKGMLEYLSNQENKPYAVEPLPVHKMAIHKKGGKYILSWEPGIDLLEPLAKAEKYKVYKRIGDEGFDNGVIVNSNEYEIEQPALNSQVSFKVTAINAGGESMSGEILSIGVAQDTSELVLVVNGFERVSPPSFIEDGDFAGVAWWDDQGVADHYDYGFTGFQYDFDRKSPWLDDDSPGWGASYGNFEGKRIVGNTFDNTLIHGKAIIDAGYSYISVSKEAFEDENYDCSHFATVDIILGEEKATPSYRKPGNFDFQIYSSPFMSKIEKLNDIACPFFISGAYVGTEIHMLNDTIIEQFVKDNMHFIWRTNHAVKTGGVQVTNVAHNLFTGNLEFNTGYDPNIYTVEAPDAIEPFGDKSLTALRYDENKSSAAVVYLGDNPCIVVGFPFETITDIKVRENFMKEVLQLLINRKVEDLRN